MRLVYPQSKKPAELAAQPANLKYYSPKLPWQVKVGASLYRYVGIAFWFGKLTTAGGCRR
jgi:hypothetical protein